MQSGRRPIEQDKNRKQQHNASYPDGGPIDPRSPGDSRVNRFRYRVCRGLLYFLMLRCSSLCPIAFHQEPCCHEEPPHQGKDQDRYQIPFPLNQECRLVDSGRKHPVKQNHHHPDHNAGPRQSACIFLFHCRDIFSSLFEDMLPLPPDSEPGNSQYTQHRSRQDRYMYRLKF